MLHIPPKNVFEAILKYGHDEDFDPINGENFHQTSAPAGSSLKVEVLRRRVELGQPLWHSDDRVDYAGYSGGITPAPKKGGRHSAPTANTDDSIRQKTAASDSLDSDSLSRDLLETQNDPTDSQDDTFEKYQALEKAQAELDRQQLGDLDFDDEEPLDFSSLLAVNDAENAEARVSNSVDTDNEIDLLNEDFSPELRDAESLNTADSQENTPHDSRPKNKDTSRFHNQPDPDATIASDKPPRNPPEKIEVTATTEIHNDDSEVVFPPAEEAYYEQLMAKLRAEGRLL